MDTTNQKVIVSEPTLRRELTEILKEYNLDRYDDKIVDDITGYELINCINQDTEIYKLIHFDICEWTQNQYESETMYNQATIYYDLGGVKRIIQIDDEPLDDNGETKYTIAEAVDKLVALEMLARAEIARLDTFFKPNQNGKN